MRSGLLLVTSSLRPLASERSSPNEGRGVEEMLEVVDEQQELLAAKRAGKILAHADRAGDLR